MLILSELETTEVSILQESNEKEEQCVNHRHCCPALTLDSQHSDWLDSIHDSD